jgi:hypothetical protein
VLKPVLHLVVNVRAEARALETVNRQHVKFPLPWFDFEVVLRESLVERGM